MTRRDPSYFPKRPYSHCKPDEEETSFAFEQLHRPSMAKIVWSGFKFLCRGREKSFVANRLESEIYAREGFRKLLTAPFPNRSDREIAEQWAKALGVSERTVQNWLALTHSASITDMAIVVATHGVWRSAEIFVGEDTRAGVMGRIGR